MATRTASSVPLLGDSTCGAETDRDPQEPVPGAASDGDLHGCAPAAGDEARRRFVVQLFERHRHGLLRHLSGLLSRRSDAEDVLQETYARLLNARELDTNDSRAPAYVFRVATNLAYDHFRRRAARGIETVSEGTEPASLDDSPEMIVDFAQGLEIVEKTLRELKPRCRRVFVLRASEDLSYEAIAERLGISKRTVEREMKHALDVCQRRLKRSQR